MFKSTGKLVYNPTSHLGSNQKWLVLMADDNIGRYYRSLYHQEFFYKPKLIQPVWGAHVSCIRGEYVPNIHLWGLNKNKIIEFEYSSGVFSNDEYHWLEVTCPELEDLRLKYGLSKYPKFGYHLTIGRVSG